MNFPRMRTLGKPLLAALALILSCLPAGAIKNGNDDGAQKHEHTIPPNQQHGSAQASLQIQVAIAPVVLPPRHKDHDRDNDNDRDRDAASVVYLLSPSSDKFSISREARAMLVDSGKQEQVQLTTVVSK